MQGNGLARRLALAIACLLAILAPIPFGATHPMAIVALALTLATALGLLLLGRNHLPRPPTRFAWLAILTIALALFQLVPLPAPVVETLSPRLAAEARESLAFPGADATLVGAEASIARLAGDERPETSWRPLSVDPDGSIDGTERLTIALAAFFLGLLAVSDSRDRRLLVGAVALSAFLQAVYGLAESLSGNFHALYYTRVHYIPLASGTFICPNHFAALLSLGLFCLLGLLSELWLRGEDRTSDRLAKTALAATAAGVILVAMIWSSSRAGLAAAAFGIVVFAGLALWRFGGGRSRIVGALLVSSLLVALVSGAIWIRPPEPLANDVENVAIDLDGRLSIWRSTTEIVKAFPLVGSGIGTYRHIHPFFRNPTFTTRTRHSHNDYYEWISDMGLVGAPLLLGWLTLLVTGAAVALRRQRGLVLTIALGAAFAALALHEVVDFSLQLSGVAVPAFLLAGAWLTPLGWGPQRRTSRDPRTWRRSLVFVALTLVGLGALTLWGLRPLPPRPEQSASALTESGHLRRWARGVVDDIISTWQSEGRIDIADANNAAQPLGAALLSLQKGCQRAPLRGELRLSLWLATQSLAALHPPEERLGQELSQLSDYYLHRAEELAPYDRQRQLKLIRTWLLAGKPSEARRISRKLLAMDPYKADEVYELLGGDSLDLADLMEATPNQAGAALRLARYLAGKRRDQVGAQIVLERALARDPDNWSLRVHGALRLDHRGRFTEALALLDEGPAPGPIEEADQRSAVWARALAHAGLGEIDRLDSLLPKLKQWGFSSSETAYLRGRTFVAAGRPEEAIEPFMASLDPRNTPLREGEHLRALLELGRIERQRGHYDKALTYFRQVREIRPENPQALAFFREIEAKLPRSR